MDFSRFFLVGTNMVHYCIAEFLTCPFNLKILFLFRDQFFDVPDGESKARRKIGFNFGMIISDLDVPPPTMGIQPPGRLFHKCDESKTLPTERPGFDLGCHCQCTFRKLL